MTVIHLHDTAGIQIDGQHHLKQDHIEKHILSEESQGDGKSHEAVVDRRDACHVDTGIRMIFHFQDFDTKHPGQKCRSRKPENGEQNHQQCGFHRVLGEFGRGDGCQHHAGRGNHHQQIHQIAIRLVGQNSFLICDEADEGDYKYGYDFFQNDYHE